MNSAQRVAMATIALLACPPASLFARTGQGGVPMTPPHCDVLIFNNPPSHGHLYNPFKKEDIPIEGRPFARVVVRGLPVDAAAKAELTITGAGGRTVFEGSGELEPQHGGAGWTAYFPQPLDHPQLAEMRVTQGGATWPYRQEIRLHRLYGRITDFAGRPIAGFVGVNDYSEAVVQADADGRYEMWLPEAHLAALTIADSEYARTSVEVWVCEYLPRGDLELNPRIGQLELYEFHAWRGYTGLKVDFIPMSIGLGNRLMRAVGDDLGDYFGHLPDAKAFLDREDIRVDLDGAPLTIQGLWAREDLMSAGGQKDGVADSRPEYTLQTSDFRGDNPRGTTQVLRVVLTRRYLDGDKLIEEKGEGYYLGLRAGWSASGGAE